MSDICLLNVTCSMEFSTVKCTRKRNLVLSFLNSNKQTKKQWSIYLLSRYSRLLDLTSLLHSLLFSYVVEDVKHKTSRNACSCRYPDATAKAIKGIETGCNVQKQVQKSQNDTNCLSHPKTVRGTKLHSCSHCGLSLN